MGITKVSVRPGETGFGYKAVFYGDEMVLAQLDSFGFTMNLSGSTVELTRMMNASELVMGREYSLLLRNYDIEHFGTADVNAEVLLKLKDGTVIHSSKVSYSMMTMLRQLCQNMDILSNEQLRALRTMCLPFKAVMSSWGVDALFADK